MREDLRVALRLLDSCRQAAPSPSYRRFEEQKGTRRTQTMEWIRRMLRSEIRESNIGIALILCLLVMSAMSIALVWQAQIIANQRDAIRWLEQVKLGN